MLPENWPTVSTSRSWLIDIPRINFSWNHQSGSIEVRHSKRVAKRFARGRVKMNTPDIVETSPTRQKIDNSSIRRPTRLVVPILAVREPNPRATGSAHRKKSGFCEG